MVVNIILSLFLITFIVFLIMIYVWWRNFGVDIIKMTKDIIKMNNQYLRNKNNGKNPQISDQLKIIRDFFNNKKIK